MLRTLARRALSAGEIMWTASLVAAAFAAARAHTGSISHALAMAEYAAGSLVCHQRPERSFHMWGVQLPVCARCTGIYVGAACASFAPARRRVLRPAILLAAAAVPALLSLVFEWTTGVTPSNVIRAATGFLIGAAVMAVLRGELAGE
jgi:uncharacterized membrane protein